MSEQIILNESAAWDQAIEDSMTPDYGFQLSRPSTRALVKVPGGRPYSREVANSGHTFSLSWLNRSFKCVQRVKWFYEQFADGFFTIIDHDGGGRHYVGRFTGDLSIVEVANDKYSIQGLTFEEIPGVPMKVYPFNWERDSIVIRPTNDFGDIAPWVSGTWARSTLATGTPVLVNAGNLNNFATVEYRGYGFQLYMRKGPAQGMISVFVDGALLANIVDLYDPTERGLVKVQEVLAMRLDFHRVKVNVAQLKNDASSSTSVSFGFLRVMQ